MVKIKRFSDFRVYEFFEMHDLDDVFVNALERSKLEEVYNKKESKLLEFNNANELIRYYFNPEDNGFKLVNYNQLINEMVDNNEIWTDSPCILVRLKKCKL